jgi:hypothetical protein
MPEPFYRCAKCTQLFICPWTSITCKAEMILVTNKRRERPWNESTPQWSEEECGVHNQTFLREPCKNVPREWEDEAGATDSSLGI